MSKNQGTIKKVISDRGFGFIKSEDKDYFFHFSNMVDPKQFKNILAGLKVEFSVSKDRNDRDIAIAIDIKE